MIRKCILAGAAILVSIGLVSWATATDSHAQQEVGGDYFESIGEIVMGDESELLSKKDSTEEEQF